MAQRKHEPNGIQDQCQCVMDHWTLIDGDITQCPQRRWEKSNVFCFGCEKRHGDALTEKEAKNAIS